MLQPPQHRPYSLSARCWLLQSEEGWFFFASPMFKGLTLNPLFSQKAEFGTMSDQDEKVARSLLDLRKRCNIAG